MDITYIVPRNDDSVFERCLLRYFKQKASRTIQISNNPEIKSICHKYSKGIDICREKNLLDGVIIFSHEDITILDNFFEDKIKYIFETNNSIGVVGVVGTELVSEKGWFLEKENKPKGKIIQGVSDLQLIKFGEVGFYDNVISVDNCIFAVRASLFNQIDFDIENLLNDNHHYSTDICLQALKCSYKICVADILVQHESTEHFKPCLEWEESKETFIEKYSDLKFPISVNNFRGESTVEVTL